MTILYKPVLIESAEQAEALPDGVLAFAPFEPDPELMDPEAVGFRWSNFLVKYGDLWEAPEGGGDWTMHELLVGWTALVPIEAKEETNTRWDEGDPVNDFTKKSRYVTPWEKA